MALILLTPHGDKLKSLLENGKLPTNELPRVQAAIARYQDWLNKTKSIHGSTEQNIADMVQLFNDYRLYIDLELIFDSPDDFLYRQKGQLKLDNSVIEEFLPILISTILAQELGALDLSFGPPTSYASLRFESSIRESSDGGGPTVRGKDQDFAISKRLFIKASHYPDFKSSVSRETSLAYLAAECKTNLDKTMFQEAAATALDVKTAVPAAKYYLLCEWLDMTPISTATTAIDEAIILRKHRRLAANVREQFNTFEGRKRNRAMLVDYLNAHPFAPETFARFINHIRALFGEETEEHALGRGYF